MFSTRESETNHKQRTPAIAKLEQLTYAFLSSLRQRRNDSFTMEGCTVQDNAKLNKLVYGELGTHLQVHYNLLNDNKLFYRRLFRRTDRHMLIPLTALSASSPSVTNENLKNPNLRRTRLSIVSHPVVTGQSYEPSFQIFFLRRFKCLTRTMSSEMGTCLSLRKGYLLSNFYNFC